MNCLLSKLNELCDIIKKEFKPKKNDKMEHANKDLESVMVASKLLQVSEFSFFNLAYVQWYGREIQANAMEKIFATYMFEDVVPHWVRHLARRVLSTYDIGTLDPSEFNLERPKPSPRLRYTGMGYSIMLTIVMVIFCMLITGHISPQ